MAESGVISTHRSTVYGKKVILESYNTSDILDGMFEQITDKDQPFPIAGKPFIVRRDLAQQAGLTQKIAMLGKLTGEGVDGDSTLEGNEKEMLTYTQAVTIDQKRQSVKTKGMLDEQASPVKLFPYAQPLLSSWQGDIRVKEVIRKAAGATSKTWSNTPTAATSNRVLYASTATSTATITSTMLLDPDTISRAVTLAENEYLTGTDGEYIPPMAKINFGGKGSFYLLLAHPEAYADLYRDTEYAQMLREAQQYQKDNSLIKGGDLFYRGVLIRSCQYLRESNTGQFSNWGSGSATNGCINLFLGAGAVAVSECKNAQYIPQDWDYKNKRGLAIANIWGVQKAKYNGQDLSTVSVKTAY